MKKIILLLSLIIVGLSSNNDQVRLSAQSKKSIQSDSPRYQLAVCDWMILKRQKIGAFELARQIGSDGLEMDMGGLGKRDSFDNKLRDPHFQQLFRETASATGIQVPSVAMSAFYAQSFVARPNYRELVQDCLNTMQVMGAKVAFLPLGVQVDLNKNPELRPELIKRLKVVGKMARKAGVVIGIETSLDAREELKLLKEVNSKGIAIYFNFQNPLEGGRDLYEELKILGPKNICMIHCTDTDGVTLPNNTRLDMHRVKAVLDQIGWSGWLVVERSRNKDDARNVKGNFTENLNYLRTIFQQ